MRLFLFLLFHYDHSSLLSEKQPLNSFQNGKFTVVGTYDGRCIFYETEQLKYFTQINVRSTRGKNAKGRKITGIEPLPGEDKVTCSLN